MWITIHELARNLNVTPEDVQAVAEIELSNDDLRYSTRLDEDTVSEHGRQVITQHFLGG